MLFGPSVAATRASPRVTSRADCVCAAAGMRPLGAAAGEPVSLAAVLGAEPRRSRQGTVHEHGADIVMPDLPERVGAS